MRTALTDPRASLLAATAPHSGDKLIALPIASCELCMDDESVSLSSSGSAPGTRCLCSCGEDIDACGQHAFVSKRAAVRTQRHQALNEVVVRSFASAAGIPVSKEPNGISRQRQTAGWRQFSAMPVRPGHGLRMSWLQLLRRIPTSSFCCYCSRCSF